MRDVKEGSIRKDSDDITIELTPLALTLGRAPSLNRPKGIITDTHTQSFTLRRRTHA